MSPRHCSVYLDTNIISSLCRVGRDDASVARSEVTSEWWRLERPFFRVFCSGFVEDELSEGIYRGQEHAIALVRRVPYLAENAQVRETARTYVQQNLVPSTKPGDATHLAFAAVYGLDYLLSWNQSHLANEDTQARLLGVNAGLGLHTPWLRTPLTIPRASMGQQLRRES